MDMEDKTIFCGSCEYEKVSTVATKWCSECDEGYCDSCINGHRTHKKLREHHIISAADHAKMKRFHQNNDCNQHRKSIDFFCRVHDKLLCLSCLQTSHSSCEEVLSIEEASKGTKKSTALSDMEYNLKGVLDNIEKGLRVKNDISEQANTVKQKIREMREKLNKRLDELESRILKDLTAKQTQINFDFEKGTTELRKKREILSEMENSMAAIRDFASDQQTFISTRTMNEIIYREKEEVRTLLSAVSCKEIDFIPREEICNLSTLHAFGDIKIKSSKDSLYKDPNVEGAQLPVQSLSNINSLQLVLKQEFDVKAKDVYFCLVLPNKQLLFGDNDSNKILIHNADGSYSHDIPLKSKVFSATVIDSHRVAMTGPAHVDIVDVKTATVEKTLKQRSGCSGLCYYKNSLYVSVTEGNIHIIDLDGTTTGTIPLDCTVRSFCISNGRMYYCDWKNKEVYCCDMQGNEQWRLKDDAFGYYSSLSLGRSNGLFANSYPDDNLFVFNIDGKNKRKLLDKSNKLNGPSAVHCDQVNNTLLVCNKRDGRAALYNVTY